MVAGQRLAKLPKQLYELRHPAVRAALTRLQVLNSCQSLIGAATQQVCQFHWTAAHRV